jgi:hypothetical protein
MGPPTLEQVRECAKKIIGTRTAVNYNGYINAAQAYFTHEDKVEWRIDDISPQAMPHHKIAIFMYKKCDPEYDGCKHSTAEGIHAAFKKYYEIEYGRYGIYNGMIVLHRFII